MKVRQGLPIPGFWKSSRPIEEAKADTVHQGNPYRAILRRDYPEPLIALLAFLLGIWLWDQYFGKVQGYPPGTEEIALVKIDRDLRLSEAMREDPPWLKWLAGTDEPVVVRRGALEVFEKLAAEKSITPKGLEAFAMVKAEQEGLPIRAVLGQFLQGQMISDFEETSRDLASHHGTWWHAKLIESWEEKVPPAAYWREGYGAEMLQLKTRAVFARSAVWLLGLVGLVFLPNALLCLKRGVFAKPKGYAKAWSISLGLVVFLVATLAWIGFSTSLELGISSLPGLHPAVGIFLDSAARMLPSLIALALLFRKPTHAIRVMGLERRIAVKTMLGMFSLLMIFDQVLRWAMNGAGSNDPGGGLSLGDAGLWGLAFTLVSACLLAPVAEEMLYRGVLFRSCRNRLGVVPAALFSSAVFATLHFYDGYGLVSVGVFGFSCALLYSGTGSLSTVIALHMLYNTAIKIPEWIVYHAPLG
jgi:membrane protease YdiL (CAAX protease family)